MGDLPLSPLRLPTTLPIGCRSSPLTIAFLPPSNMLPLLENSSCPGLVRSSKLLVGISVIMLMEGNCRIVEPADNWEPPLNARSLGAFAASRGGAAWKLGRLVDGRTLRFKETASVSRVVRLSLNEDDVDGARPESLLASWGSFDRALGLDGERGFLSRLMALFEGGFDGRVIGIGGLAAVVFSYAIPLKLSSLDLLKGTCCGGTESDAIAPRLELGFNGRGCLTCGVTRSSSAYDQARVKPPARCGSSGRGFSMACLKGGRALKRISACRVQGDHNINFSAWYLRICHHFVHIGPA